MIKKGEIVYGKITNIISYGAFVVVDDSDGLIHISEFSDYYVRSIGDFVEVGDRVKLKVLDVDEKRKQLKLSYKHIYRTRGKVAEIPEYEIGFKSLEAALPGFIAKGRKEGE